MYVTFIKNLINEGLGSMHWSSFAKKLENTVFYEHRSIDFL